MTPRRIADLVEGVLARRTGQEPTALAPVLVSAATPARRGDFTTPAVLRVAAAHGLDPWPLAVDVAGELGAHPDLAAAVASAPGHLNVTLTLESLVRAALMAPGPAVDIGVTAAADPLPARWRVLARDVGEDVARWHWAQDAAADPDRLDRRAVTVRRLDNPVFRVLYAHARAVAAGRAAAVLGDRVGSATPAAAAFAGPQQRRVLVALADLVGPTLPTGPPARRHGLLRRIDALAVAYLDGAVPTGVPDDPGVLTDHDVGWYLLAAATARHLAHCCARIGVALPPRV